MSLEAIKTIAEVEEKAEKIRADASVDAKKIIASAEENGRQYVERSKAEADAEVKRLYAKADERGQAAAAEILAQAKEECKKIEAEAVSKLDRAVDMIVRKVVND